jgi:membrane-associated PAP2 superfamily phosphatase
LHARSLAIAGALAACAAALALFHGSALDRAATRHFYDAASASFPLKDAPLLAVIGHTGLKWAGIAAWLACVAAGGAWRRGAWYALAIAAAVAILKQASPWSCPWDLPEFGGAKPGAGGCLPAAHPLSGFAFFGVAAAVAASRPRSARAVLFAAAVAGGMAGAVQVARGAHFVSHVLATGWFAVAIMGLLAAFERRRL